MFKIDDDGMSDFALEETNASIDDDDFKIDDDGMSDFDLEEPMFLSMTMTLK